MWLQIVSAIFFIFPLTTIAHFDSIVIGAWVSYEMCINLEKSAISLSNKIVFTKAWYVSASLSISSNLQPLHKPSCIFKCYSYIVRMCQTICDVTSSNVLGRLVQYELKEWDRGRWVGTYTQWVKTAWLCVGLAVKVGSLHKWSWKTVVSPQRAGVIH